MWCKTSKSFLLPRSNIVLLKHETYPDTSVVDITEDSFSISAIQIMLLYGSTSSSLTNFYNTLENLLSQSHIIDIVPGDFNADVLNNANIKLQLVLFNHTLLVNEGSHVSGSLIDVYVHIYVNKGSLHKFSIDKTEIVNIYFSGHDVVKRRLHDKY